MLLHHYTSANGLYGILKNKEIWSTDYRFLNDAQELSFGLGLIVSKIIERNDLYDIIDPSVYLYVIESIVKQMPPPCLVASFSTKGDLLSQWRGYGNGDGFCISFDRDRLEALGNVQGFRLVEVRYDADGQYEVSLNAAMSLSQAIQNPNGASDLGAALMWWENELPLFCLQLKHPSFAEEAEWRLIRTTSDLAGIRARPTAKGFVPYYPVSLLEKPAAAEDQQNQPLKTFVQEIRVGPNHHGRQEAALFTLLNELGYHSTIKRSDIPFVGN